MANNKFFGAVGLTGGSDGDLDNIDGTSLIEADGVVVVSSGRQGSGRFKPPHLAQLNHK